MYRLTDKRLQKAQPILDKYRADLFTARSFAVRGLERELRDTWSLGYQELKDIIRELLKNDRYREVAAYYMERSNPVGVVSEFQQPLAYLYGLKWFHAPEREGKRAAFWERVFATKGQPPFPESP
jgi:hypothetical protein